MPRQGCPTPRSNPNRRFARIERAILITNVPGTWLAAKPLITKLARKLRAEGYQFQWAYNIEENPKGSGYHTHMWQRGDYIPREHLSEISESIGMGYTWVEPMRQPHGIPLPYSMKLGLVDGASTRHQADTQLALYGQRNGGRIVRASRDMFLDRAGNRTTLTGALREARLLYQVARRGEA